MPVAAGRRIEVRRIEVSDWPVWRELRLGALSEAAYAFSSRLADWQGAGDSPQRWMERLRSVPANFVGYLDGDALGMASGRPETDGSAQLLSFWVAPAARGTGLSDAIIESVDEWAAAEGLRPLFLQVKIDNTRARAAYRRCGFREGYERPADDADELTMVREP